MNLRNLVSASALVLIGATSLMGQDVGDLKITFKYQGDAPDQKELEVTQDKQFCLKKGAILDETLIVNKENKGIKNIVVYAYTSRRGGMKLPAQDPANNKHTLANEQCRFEPRVTLTQVGDSIDITNPDDVGHNANLIFLGNEPQNFQIPPKQSKSVTMAVAEPTVASVQCNIHPWMKGYILAVDHPFFGVTDENGEVTVKGLPAGEVVLRAWHENGTFSKKIVVNGEETKWSKNVFEFELKAGENDYGTVEVPADQFRINQ